MISDLNFSLPEGCAYRLNVDAADYGLVSDRKRLPCQLTSTDDGTFTLHLDKCTILLRGARASIATMLAWLIDVLISKALVGDGSDVLLLRSAGPEGVLLAKICYLQRGKWEATVTERTRAIDLEDSFTLSEGDEQVLAIQQSFARYCDWAGVANTAMPRDFIPRRRLVLKIDIKELWFLRFPIAMFCHLRLGIFALYESVQSIVTDRTLTQVAAMTREIELEIASTETFLRNVYVVLNTYGAQLQAYSDLRGCTNLLVDVLQGFAQ